MSCPSCGAALAEDQRYCLNCGRRQGEARVDFRRHLNPAQVPAKEAATPANGQGDAGAIGPVTPPPEKRQRDYAPLAAAGGIAVLGVMLLIGVLIGRGTGSEQTSAPQVVTVAGAESSKAGGSVEGGATEESDKAKEKATGKSGRKQKTVAGGSSDTGNAPVASSGQLEALQGKTGQEYAEESAKLPDEIATEGEPPPVDDKAPGGGSGGGVTLE